MDEEENLSPITNRRRPQSKFSSNSFGHINRGYGGFFNQSETNLFNFAAPAYQGAKDMNYPDPNLEEDMMY